MKKPPLFFLLEITVCLLCVCAALLPSLWSHDFLLIPAYVFSHLLYPLAALLLPLLSARAGMNAFVCALPPFLLYIAAWTAFGLNLPAMPTILTLVFSVLGANIGAEIHKRSK